MSSIKEDHGGASTAGSTASDEACEGPVVDMTDERFHELPKSPLNHGSFSRAGF